MHYLSLDHLVVCVFLLITLVVGLWAGRGIKDIREYAIANRVYGTGVLTITFLATLIGGSTIMGVVKNVFNDGIIPFITICVGPVVCMVWMALWVAPKMIHFEGCLTMGDVMGTLYGKQVQVATGVVGFLFTLCAVSAQIMALAYVYEFLLGFKSHWAIGLGGLIAITYAAFGGMKAVTITDVLQFVVLVIVVPMITHVMMHEVGGIKALWSRVSPEKLQIADHPKLGYYTSLSLFLCVFSPSLLSPPFVARMLMARDKQQVTHMLFMGGTFILFFLLLITLVGLAAFVLFPTLAPDKILPHVVNVFFPAGLRGLCATGLIAVIMSTADSFLHAAGLSVTHDVIRPLRATQFQELRWVKYCTFGIGCAAILLTLKIHSVFDIIIYGMGIMGATITVPFVAGVLGLKTDPRSFKIALWGTIPVFIATNVWFGTAIQHWAYPVSLMVNVLLFLGTHVLQNRGLVVERRTGHQRLLGHPTWSSWTEWLPTPKKLIAYSNQKLSQYGYDSVLFGLFLSLNYMVPFFMHGYSNPTTYGWILAVKSISIFLCVGLLLKPYWPKKLLTYFPTYYHLTLLYCLPFVTTFLFLLEERNIEWVVNIALSILFLIVLVDWLSFILLSILGITLGLAFYQLAIGSINLQLDFGTGYLLVYTCIFSTLIALLFARRREQHLEAKLREIAAHYHTMYSTKTQDHPAAMRIANMIDHQVQESMAHYSLSLYDDNNMRQSDAFHTSTDCLQYFFPTALAVIQQGEQITAQIVQALKEHYMGPQSALLSLQSCVTTIVEAYHRRHAPSMQVDLELEKDYKIATSYAHLKYALIHVLRFMHAHDLSKQVRLWLTHPKGIHLRLSGHSLSLSSLDELCMLFPARATTKHLGLAISKLLLEAQGGDLLYAVNDLPKNTYTEFILTLPPTSLKDQLSA